MSDTSSDSAGPAGPTDPSAATEPPPTAGDPTDVGVPAGSPDTGSATTQVGQTRYLGPKQTFDLNAAFTCGRPPGEDALSCTITHDPQQDSRVPSSLKDTFKEYEGALHNSERTDAIVLTFPSPSAEITCGEHRFRPHSAVATPLPSSGRRLHGEPTPYKTVVYGEPDGAGNFHAITTTAVLTRPAGAVKENLDLSAFDLPKEDEDDSSPKDLILTYQGSHGAEQADVQTFHAVSTKATAVRVQDNGDSAVYTMKPDEELYMNTMYGASGSNSSVVVLPGKGRITIRSTAQGEPTTGRPEIPSGGFTYTSHVGALRMMNK